jgi:hypothetical protein
MIILNPGEKKKTYLPLSRTMVSLQSRFPLSGIEARIQLAAQSLYWQYYRRNCVYIHPFVSHLCVTNLCNTVSTIHGHHCTGLPFDQNSLSAIGQKLLPPTFLAQRDLNIVIRQKEMHAGRGEWEGEKERQRAHHYGRV